MAFPTTYTGWLTYLRDWTQADEYSDGQLGSFLDLAQLRLNREMESYSMEAKVTFAIVDTNPINLSSIAADFRKVRLVVVQGFPPLDVASLVEIQQLLQVTSDAVIPEKYCIDAGLLYLYPNPGVGNNLDFYYYKEIPALSASPVVNTNVFSLYYPDALLYAALLAAAPYMEEEEKVEAWSNAYLAALSTANDESNHIKKGSTPLVRKVLTYG